MVAGAVYLRYLLLRYLITHPLRNPKSSAVNDTDFRLLVVGVMCMVISLPRRLAGIMELLGGGADHIHYASAHDRDSKYGNDSNNYSTSIYQSLYKQFRSVKDRMLPSVWRRTL